ncbi:hypothetical protein CRG98_029655 [Punica granatum]|uniref:WAT1-related protein n=1 Tax=Punica granatum TaxID=22663 RepID=A0A2I0J144_PUNGR|nr:hypothetical protein CRG98_029655 [Punica granatum]
MVGTQRYCRFHLTKRRKSNFKSSGPLARKVSFSLLIFSNSNDNLILCALRQISSLQAQLPSSHFLAPPQILLVFPDQVNETPLIIPSYFKELIIGGFLVVLIITFYISLFSAVLAALLSLITVRDPGTWALKVDSGLVAIIYSTLAGTLFRVTVIMWCLKRRGPVYVAMFQPLGIIFAVVLGVIVLGDSICCGSLIGAVLTMGGYYAVMWGKAKEVEDMASGPKAFATLPQTCQKIPLLIAQEQS